MMRRTINLLLMLLFVAEVTFANTVDFDKAFKESARIEKQIKRTSFPKRTFLITDFGAKRMMRLILAMKPLIRLFYSAVCQEVAQ